MGHQIGARADIAIVGAGMAGASLAAELAPHARVILLEAEDLPGRHATGRSAAFWTESYGGPAVQPLTSASGPLLARPSADLGGRSFLRPRGALHIADETGTEALDTFIAAFSGSGVRLDPIDRSGLEARLPGLMPDWSHGLSEPSCEDIDVAALHAAYLRVGRSNGVTLLTQARLVSAGRDTRTWRLETSAGEVRAGILVNAAGAWASEVARIAGASPIAIRPYRRTMVQLRTDPPAPPDLPLVIDAAGRFYFKPEPGGRLWLSPHDETPATPGDAQPEEIDIALAIDRLERVLDWRVIAVERAWAGLRSFAPDRAPVYGFDARAPGFFWCAGQGGFGIQTAPAAAKLAAGLVLGRPLPDMPSGIDPELYAPARFD